MGGQPLFSAFGASRIHGFSFLVRLLFPLDVQSYIHFTGSRRRYQRLVHLSIAKGGGKAPCGGFLEMFIGA